MNTGDRAVMNKAIMILLIVVAAFVLILIFAGKKGTPIANFTDTVTEQAILNVNGKHLVAAVANTPREREQGLSGTHFLNGSNGMFFIFEEADEHGFWMKDMTFSIDILWINEDNEIVDIEQNVSPNTYPQIFKSDVPAKYVLEVMAGWTQENEVEVGDTVLISEVEQ